MEYLQDEKWFQSWRWKTVGWALVCFLIISGVNGLFSFLFDVLLFNIEYGYYYTFFVLIFYSMVLCFFYSWQKKNYFGTFTFGLCGLVGIPIELWLEYYVSGALKSPWFAVGWGVVYVFYGLVADCSLFLLAPKKNEQRAIVITALIFSAMYLIISILPLTSFYHPSAEPNSHGFLDYWYFLFPFAIIEGGIGGFTGYHLGLMLRKKNEQKNAE